MIQLFQKLLIPYVFNDVKIYLFIISVLFFTILYSFCGDDEFHGWIDTEKLKVNEQKKYLQTLYNKYVNKDGSLALDSFLKMPIILKNKKYYLEDENDESTKKKEMIKSREVLFKIFDKNNDGKINENTFLNMPLRLDFISKFTEGYATTTPYGQFGNGVATDIFQRFYFSVIIQSNLGLGDLFPASKRTRIIAIVQIFITYAIIVLPYSSFKSL